MLHKKLFTTLLFSILLAASQTSTTASPPTAPAPNLASIQTLTIPTPQQGETKLSPLTLANFAVKLVVRALVAGAIGAFLGEEGFIPACLLILCSFYAYEGINKLFTAKKAHESEAAERQGSDSLHAIIQLGLRFTSHLACHLVLFFLAWCALHQKELKKIGQDKSYATHLECFKKERGFHALALGFGFLLVLYGVDIVRKVVDRWVGEGEDGKPSSWLQYFKGAVIKLVGQVLVAVVAGAIWYGVRLGYEKDLSAEKKDVVIMAVLILLSTYLYYVLGWVVDKLFALGKKGAAPSTYTAESEELAPTAA